MYETEIARIKVLKTDLEANQKTLDTNREAERLIRIDRDAIKKELNTLIATISA